MKAEWVIREETEADSQNISKVTAEAFKSIEESDQTEPFIIEELRAAKALSISLVAELNGKVVGHIAFSPVNISDGTHDWYGLGPVSVLPELQGKGIGQALIREGLSRLKDMNANGCCLVGHPGYYQKFGFKNSTKLTFEGVPQEFFMVLPFDKDVPSGKVSYHEAFNVDG